MASKSGAISAPRTLAGRGRQRKRRFVASRGTDARRRHYAAVTNPTKADRLLDRAARLHREALNCLTIAVGEKVEQHAAQLIDEAARLIRRAQELAGAER